MTPTATAGRRPSPVGVIEDDPDDDRPANPTCDDSDLGDTLRTLDFSRQLIAELHEDQPFAGIAPVLTVVSGDPVTYCAILPVYQPGNP